MNRMTGSGKLRYEAVLYDFDGTLVDTIPMILKCFHYAFSKVVGKSEEDAFLLSTIGLPLIQAFSHYEPAIQQELIEAYQEENARILETDVRLFDGIVEGLTLIGNTGVHQAVVTSKRRETALFSIRQFDLDPYFEILIAREDTTVHKPDPEPIYEAMRRLSITDSKKVLFVGDSIHDLRCANRAGVDSVMVDWTYMPREELAAENPTYWISSLSDISCILSNAAL